MLVQATWLLLCLFCDIRQATIPSCGFSTVASKYHIFTLLSKCAMIVSLVLSLICEFCDTESSPLQTSTLLINLNISEV